MKETISLHAMESIKIHDMKNTTKKVWAKPAISKLDIKNITLGSKPTGTESNPQANNGHTPS